ncbi:MAG TPA: hypothetical protein PK156_18660 [Polyangium sp.]|nr:hypothetical protein [Polyangium sp.]
MASRRRIEFGDWQTPDALAGDIVAHVLQRMPRPPATIVEPTCGRGAFLVAAARRLPTSTFLGYDVNLDYLARAASRLAGYQAFIAARNFFTVDWEREIAEFDDPILVIGNPPWVTNAALGMLGSNNLPRKQNFKHLRGLDALTGKSNFDVCEWMILVLIEAILEREGTLAMLCKSSVARRVIEYCTNVELPIAPGGLWRIDASKHFQAAVDAVLFVCRTGPNLSPAHARWPVYASLGTPVPESYLGVADGELVADLEAYQRTQHCMGTSVPEWRSGLKHDCARIMEIEKLDGLWFNGLGEAVAIEAPYLYPLLKSSDIANGRDVPKHAVIVPQRALGEDTQLLRERAPRLWTYLNRHAALLTGRKSSIYTGQPPFAIFGVGDYSFAPWKVAISGLYKRLRFSLVGPIGDQPVMLDDTCYFLPFSDEMAARRALAALESDLALDFFRARVFWDAKRPINKGILQNLDLQRLIDAAIS